MKQILLALVLCIMLAVPFADAVIFRTRAADGATFPQTGSNVALPSTITIVPTLGGTPVTVQTQAPAFAANFNVNFDTVYDVTYIVPGYTTDIDDYYFDPQLQACVPGNNCIMTTLYFVTDCKWNSTFSDWLCRETDTQTNQWITYIYNKNDPAFGEVIRSTNLMYPFVPSNQDPVLNPIGSKTISEGQALTFTVSGSDPNNDPITFDTGNIAPLPGGASFTSPAFTWTPSFSQAGSYQVTFYVRDPFGAYDSEQVTITVVDVPCPSGNCPGPCTGNNCPTGNQPPVITSSPVTSAFVNKPYAYDVNAFDPEGNSLIYGLEQAPANMTIAPTTGLIKWTPSSSQLGSHSVTLTVTDGTFVVKQHYSVRVSNAFSNIARKVLKLMRLLPAGECYAPGDSVPGIVAGDNLADVKLKEVKLTASIPELGIRRQSDNSNVKADHTFSRQLYLDLPSDTPQGEYHVRLVVSNDEVRRVRERPIIVANDCN